MSNVLEIMNVRDIVCLFAYDYLVEVGYIVVTRDISKIANGAVLTIIRLLHFMYFLHVLVTCKLNILTGFR